MVNVLQVMYSTRADTFKRVLFQLDTFEDLHTPSNTIVDLREWLNKEVLRCKERESI